MYLDLSRENEGETSDGLLLYVSTYIPTTEWRDGRFLPFPVPVADQVSVSEIGKLLNKLHNEENEREETMM